MSEHTSAEIFNRPPRIQQRGIEGEIDIPAPPKPQDEHGRNLLLSLLPLSGVLIMGVFYLIIGASSGGGRSPLMALPILMMGLVSVIAGTLTYSYQKREQRKRHITAVRDYHRLLDRRAARLQAARELQLHNNRVAFPPPEHLLPRFKQAPHTLWARRPGDPDFAHVRFGVGKPDSAVHVKHPDPDLGVPELRRAMDLAFEYRQLPGSALALNLLEHNAIGLVGERDDLLHLSYAVLAHLTTFHAPGDLHLYIFSGKAGYIAWDCVRWIPHASSDHEGGFPNYLAYEVDHTRDLADSLLRRIETRLEALEDSETPLTDKSLVVILFDTTSPIRQEASYKKLLAYRNAGVASLTLHREIAEVPNECNALVHVHGPRLRIELTGPAGLTYDGHADSLSRANLELLARRLVRFRIPAVGAGGRIPTRLEFLQMYSARTVNDLGIARRWSRPVDSNGQLPFPVAIGYNSPSTRLMFNLQENIHGPHGMIAGTTGSGKSELLQTLVLSVALENHPYLVSFLLIDYKGGSTFGIFRKLPHTVGLITNLDKTEALRALQAIKSENRRRQQFLNQVGASDITEYHQRLAEYDGNLPPDWEPLPHLLIIIDEFAELKTDLPNFLEELVATVRVGRSLGMHLVLATQRPAGHITDEMHANLQFRICLRVQSPEASHEMLRRPDAFYLPSEIIGRAYFQVGTDTQQFQVAYAGMEYEETVEEEDSHQPDVLDLVHYEKAKSLLKANGDQNKNDSKQRGEKFAAVLADHIAAQGQQMPINPLERVLLESLPARISLNRALRAYQGTDDLGGWDGNDWRIGDDMGQIKWACAPIGLVDDLENRAQPPLLVDLTESGGHLLVVGMSGTGKTMLLRTIAMSFAHLFLPTQVNLYVMSFAGRALRVLEDLPHVGAVVFNDEPERLTRLLYMLGSILEKRRRDFSMPGIGANDLEEYNRQVQKRPDLDILPAIVVLIDNFAELRESYMPESETVLSLIRDGRSVGIHFVITAPTIKLPTQALSLIEQRITLRLSDKADYMAIIGRLGKDGDLAPGPGRGYLRRSSATPPQAVQLALPADSLADRSATENDEGVDAATEIDEGADDTARHDAMLTTIKAMQQAWAGRPTVPPPVHPLPEIVPLDGVEGLLEELETPTSPPPVPVTPPDHFHPIATPLGLEGLTQTTYRLNWLQDGPHFMINGPVGSGKSTLLQTLMLGAAARYSPQALWLLLVDFSKSMTGLRHLRHLPHVVGYVTDEEQLSEQLAHFSAEMRWRREVELPEDEFLESEREGYPFPPIIIAIDDYDQMRQAITSHNQMLDDLGQQIRKDTHLGFHLLVTGETSHMSRRSDLLLQQLQLMRSGFGLCTAEAAEVMGARVNVAMRRSHLADGRGYHVMRNRIQMIQFASAQNPSEVVKVICGHWQQYERNQWQHAADKAAIQAFTAQKVASPASPPATGQIVDMFSFGDEEELVTEYRAHKKRYADEQRRQEDDQEDQGNTEE